MTMRRPWCARRKANRQIGEQANRLIAVRPISRMPVGMGIADRCVIDPESRGHAVNAPAQAVPAANPILSLNPGYGALDAAPGTGGDAVPQGGFQEVLEQHLRSAAAGSDDAAVLASAGEATLSDPVVSIQLADSSGFSGDTTAAFLALQAIPAMRAGSAATVAGGDAVQGAAMPRLQAMARNPAAGAAPMPAEGLRPDAGAGGMDMAGRAAQAADAQAAMDAVSGRRLPQGAADSPVAFRAPVAEAAALRSGAEAVRLLQAAGPAVPEPGGLAPANAQSQAVPAPADARPTVTQVPTPFGRPEWASAMNERVNWLVGQRVQSAEIQMNPPQLGPVEVRITIQNDQASLYFSSQHAAVREAIVAALPRLNEMLAQGGLSLGQTSVGAESFAGQQQASRDGGGGRPEAEVSGRLAGQVSGAPAHGVSILPGSGLGIDMFV